MDSTEENMATSRLRERFRRAAVFAMGSLFLFLAAETLNFNREAWLGVTPGYDSDSLSFTFWFYLPMMLVSNALAITAVVFYIRSMRTMRRNGIRLRALEWMTVLPILPILWFDVRIILLALWVAVGD